MLKPTDKAVGTLAQFLLGRFVKRYYRTLMELLGLLAGLVLLWMAW